MTVHTTGHARLHAPRPLVYAPTCRALLPATAAATEGGITAEIPSSADVPPEHPPVVAVWSEGFDVELDAAGLDAFLARLDDFRDGLRLLRTLMGPAWHLPSPEVTPRG
ncbi:DUF6907 domain-containing protein [Streptomyces sp. NPDC005263]|uniref:DUF6907 domain-containing protein n=1 Tax=Streptomyces sp. NPDC005263 TaxID=3364711 RepID=UPI0036A2C50F